MKPSSIKSPCQHLLSIECGGHRYIYRFISGNERALFHALLETALDPEQPIGLDSVISAMSEVFRARVLQEQEFKENHA